MLISKIHAVAGKIGNPQLMSVAEKHLVDVFFVSQMVTLQFDIKALFKYIIEPCQIGEAVAVFDTFMQKTVCTAGKAKQAG